MVVSLSVVPAAVVGTSACLPQSIGCRVHLGEAARSRVGIDAGPEAGAK